VSIKKKKLQDHVSRSLHRATVICYGEKIYAYYANLTPRKTVSRGLTFVLLPRW